jgi:hypothetical protein
VSEPIAPTLTASPGRAHLALALGLVAFGLATFVLGLVAPVVPWPIAPSALAARAAFVLAFSWVAAEALGSAWLARRTSPRRLGVTLALALLALLALAVTSGAPSLGATVLVCVALLAAGSSVGALVGGRIQHAGHLGVVAIVSSLADVVSVFHEAGPTAQVAQSAPVLSLLALSAPMIGTADVPPLLGVGDVVMASLYASAAARFALAERRTWVALAIGLAGAMLAVLLLELALPALPFLGLAIIVAHPETRLPPRHERRQAALGVALVVAVAFWFLLER